MVNHWKVRSLKAWLNDERQQQSQRDCGREFYSLGAKAQNDLSLRVESLMHGARNFFGTGLFTLWMQEKVIR